MIHLSRFLVILLILITFNTIGYSQQSNDSIRLINDALKMIQFPDPEFNSSFVPNLDTKAIGDMGFEQPNSSAVVTFKMRDGIKIHAQKFEHDSNSTVLLLHGTLSSSYTYNKMSGLLREAIQAKIIAVDLRGHGQSGGIPGDVTTLNQYAEDLEDLILAIKKENPKEVIILAGHSMGGGIVLRHAETFTETNIDAYLLFAPNLGNNAPTVSQELNLESDFIKTHLSRGLGLKVLNEFGIHKYDSLKVVYYNLPEQMPIRSYSYRSMQASFPADYRKALRSISKPMLVLVGENDEAFIAQEYPTLIKAYSTGDIFLIEGESHNGIRHNNDAMDKVREWVTINKLR